MLSKTYIAFMLQLMFPKTFLQIYAQLRSRVLPIRLPEREPDDKDPTIFRIRSSSE